MKTRLIGLLLLGVLLSACSSASTPAKAELPAGMAYAEGKEIYFVHTEASDPGVAETLTNMMNSPVLYVPSLANVPEQSLGTVYVFTNGLAGKGPFGFQPDVFDAPPGSEGYTPLRSIHLVTWSETAAPRLLTTAEEVQSAQAAGELTVETTGVVVNMPFVLWDGGKR
ncbi:MAG: hypothetical protein OHK0052_22910 [Anaerolineales bacterium]